MASNLAEKFPELLRRHGAVQRPITEARMKEICNLLWQRVGGRITANWPATLDGETFNWGRTHHGELLGKIDAALLAAEHLASTKAPEDRVRDALAQWENLVLELFRLRAESMKAVA